MGGGDLGPEAAASLRCASESRLPGCPTRSMKGPSQVRRAMGEHKANMLRSRDVKSGASPTPMRTVSEPLSQLEVLVVDCQATAAAPHGHLLEIGWARVRTAVTHAHSSLIALPHGEQIPPAVARITGISERMMTAAVDRDFAWRELSDQAA